MCGRFSGASDGAVTEKYLHKIPLAVIWITIILVDSGVGCKMDRNRMEAKIAGWILKSLLLAYALTGILLLALAMLLYKLDMDEKAVSAGIVAIYITATLMGGLAIGKMAKTRKFLWGLIVGILYFALLVLITMGVYRTLDGAVAGLVTTFLLCAGGGTIGGMIS